MSDDWYGYEVDERGWILRPGDDPLGGADVIEAMPTTEGLTVRGLWYGPRGGQHVTFGGTLGELRYLRSRLSAAITFGEEVEAKRQLWLREREETRG